MCNRYQTWINKPYKLTISDMSSLSNNQYVSIVEFHTGSFQPTSLQIVQ